MKSEWKIQDGSMLKEFVFTNFREAFSFMTQVAFEAEKINHHPEWSNVYNKVNIRLSTHDAERITDKDKELALIIVKISERFSR
jgi:4a-hydroxytetrahydrobiopterin dehydratase